MKLTIITFCITICTRIGSIRIASRIFFVWVCLFYAPFDNYLLIWKRLHNRWRAANFYLCSALMVIEQLRFLSVPHLLWHGWSSLRTRDTHTECWAFGSGAFTTSFYDLGMLQLGFAHHTLRLRHRCGFSLVFMYIPR